MAVVKTTSHSKIRGVVQFAQKRVAKIPQVGMVSYGEIHSATIASRARPPKVKLKPKAVHVIYYNEGQSQAVVATPAPGVTLDTLVQVLSAHFRDPDDRPKNGESSYAPVEIPAHVRRQQQLHVVAPNQETPVVMKPTSNTAPPAPEPTEPLKVTALQAEAYEFLLAQDASGQATAFTVERINGILRERFGAEVSNVLVAFLKRHKLAVPGDKVTTGFAAVRAFTVNRRPYIVTDHPRPEKSMAKSPAVTKSFDPLDHLTWFTKHAAVLEEAERRRRDLKKHGFEVVEFKGRLMLGPIKR